MKAQKRWLIVAMAALMFTAAIVVLPQIIGAKQSTGLPAKSLAAAPVPVRSTSQDKKNEVIVGASVHNDTSPPLRDMKQAKVARKVEKEANENPKVPATLKHVDSPDTAVQGYSLMMS